MNSVGILSLRRPRGVVRIHDPSWQEGLNRELSHFRLYMHHPSTGFAGGIFASDNFDCKFGIDTYVVLMAIYWTRVSYPSDL